MGVVRTATLRIPTDFPSTTLVEEAYGIYANVLPFLYLMEC